MAWSDIKDLFYTVGAIAGVLALLRPVVETKFTRDQAHLAALLKSFDELSLVGLAGRIDGQRQIPDDDFIPLRILAYARTNNLESVRFSGPIAKYILHEIDAIIKAYEELREFIQVDEWEPIADKRDDGSECAVWTFNKYASAFTGDDGVPRNYAQHLAGAASKVNQLRRAFQRLQVVSELHFLEAPLAGRLLKSRFRSHRLGDA